MNLKTVKSHNTTQHNTTQHNTTKIVLSSLLLSILFLFTSCENFLNGSALKEEIDSFITYANAPYVKVNITAVGIETASIVPAAGTYSDKYKSGDSFEIRFEAQTGYSFSHWEVTPEGAVTFANKNSASTTVKINSVDTPLTIKPYALPRPKVVSATPAFDSNGVYRDRTIIVMFNKEMDESSIYWTEKELREMGVFETALRVDDSQYYYAYKDSVNPNIYTYKNIEITKYNDTSVNLLQYYGVPKFDKTNKKILRIPANNESIPPSATDILVTLKKDFFYKTDDLDTVSLSEDYDWPYYTNGNFDSEPPEFVDGDDNGFTVTIADPAVGGEDQKNYNKNNTAVKQNTNDFIRSNLNVYKSLNLKNKKLWVRGSFTDVGSGPGSLKWEVYRVNNECYPCTEKEEQQLIQAGQIKNLSIIGANATINPIYEQGTSFDKGGELVEITNLEKEGLYRIDFIASDKNERSIRRSYYFVHDVETKSLFTENIISNSRPSYNNETVSWSEPSNPDFDHAIVECWLNGTQVGTTFEDSAKAKNSRFTGLSNHTKYEYRFYSVDIYGNKSEDYVVWKDNKAPDPVTNTYGGGRKNKKVHLYFDTPGDDFDHVEIYKWSGKGDRNSLANYTKENLSVKKLDGVASALTVVDQKSKHYEVRPDSDADRNSYYKIISVDYAGNKSETGVWQGYAQPGMICYNNSRNEIFVSWEIYKNQNPVGVLYTVDEYLNTWGKSGRKANLVYDMKEYSDQYFWGEDNGDPKNGDGKKYNGWDDYVNFTDREKHLNLYNKTVNCHSAYNKRGQTSYTIWYELYFNVNKQSIDKDNKIIWYVPAIDQFDTIISNRDSIDDGFKKLTEAGYNPVLQTSGKRLGSSSTTNDGDCYYVLNAGAIPNKRFGIVREDRDNVGTSYWHCIAEINLD